MKILSLLLILVLAAGCVAPPAPTAQRGITGTLSGDIYVDGGLAVRDTLTVSGATTLAAIAPTSLTVSGATALNGGLTMDTSAFTVADTSGNVATAGTLSVGGGFGSTGCSISAAGVLQCDGAVTFGSTLAVTGTQTFTGATAADGGLTVGGGFGSTGCTVSTAGAVSCDGAVILGSTLAVTGAQTFTGATTHNAAVTINNNATITGTLAFEGATDDTVETIVTVTDPTGADKTITLPNYSGTVLLSSTANEPDTSNAFWVNTGDLKWEGSSADAYETTLTLVNPTAARTITLPNASGTVALISGATTIVVGSSTVTGTATVTHGLTTPLYVLCSIGSAVQAATDALCSGVITSTTVTLNVWNVDGVTAGVVPTVVYWQVTGTP